MKNRSPEVDRYIRNAAPFAQPILERIRSAVHKAHPEVEEVMKWSVPHFDYKGPLAGMAAFKQHVAWGFWKAPLMSDPHGLLASQDDTRRTKVTALAEMPSEKILIEYVREAIRLNEEGTTLSRPKRAAVPDVEVPPDLAAALKKAPKAKKAFDAFPPSHRREYIEWIAEAKQAATRERRLATTIEWISEGKPRNWKYMKK